MVELWERVNLGENINNRLGKILDSSVELEILQKMYEYLHIAEKVSSGLSHIFFNFFKLNGFFWYVPTRLYYVHRCNFFSSHSFPFYCLCSTFWFNPELWFLLTRVIGYERTAMQDGEKSTFFFFFENWVFLGFDCINRQWRN